MLFCWANRSANGWLLVGEVFLLSSGYRTDEHRLVSTIGSSDGAVWWGLLCYWECSMELKFERKFEWKWWWMFDCSTAVSERCCGCQAVVLFALPLG